MNQTGPPSDFAEVTAELDRRRFISMGFERIEALLSALDHPERELRVVQVVGTNGKGTTSVALSAALEIACETTGTYLSPHVASYAERVRLRGDQVPEEAFAEGMGRVIRVADEAGIEVTQFELLTAGALAMFRDAGVTLAIMEAGLGARYDATTVARPEAVVLTNVALDHTEYLGETIEAIAKEKLASVPQDGILIVGTNDPTVTGLSQENAHDKNATLHLVADSVVGLVKSPALDGLAPYAAYDVAFGFLAAEILLGRSLRESVLELVAKRVVGSLPGRFQVFDLEGVPVVLDGGHNPEGTKSALRAVEAAYPGRGIGVVFGVLRDKDIQSMLESISGRAAQLVLTRPVGERAADPEEVMQRYAPGTRSGEKAQVRGEIGEALDLMSGLMRRDGGVVLVTGSLSTVAAALAHLSGGDDED